MNAEQARRWQIEDARSAHDRGIITPESLAILAAAEAEKQALPPVESVNWRIIKLATDTPKPPRPFTGSKNSKSHKATYTTGRISTRNTSDMTTDIDYEA